MNFRYRLMTFMQGRYGLDTTFFVCLAVSCVLAFVNVWVRAWWLQAAVYALELVALYRCFSRRIEARQRENRVISGWVMTVGDRLKKWNERLRLSRRRRRDPFNVWRTCKGCKAVLRLPRKPGKHSVICPRCGRSFSVYVPKRR